jgi:hypothetical protein
MLIGAAAFIAPNRPHCSGVVSQNRIGLRSLRTEAWPMPALFTSASILPLNDAISMHKIGSDRLNASLQPVRLSCKHR